MNTATYSTCCEARIQHQGFCPKCKDQCNEMNQEQFDRLDQNEAAMNRTPHFTSLLEQFQANADALSAATEPGEREALIAERNRLNKSMGIESVAMNTRANEDALIEHFKGDVRKARTSMLRAIHAIEDGRVTHNHN